MAANAIQLLSHLSNFGKRLDNREEKFSWACLVN